MNLLFVSYGTWNNNSGYHIQALARSLNLRDCDCRVAVPKIKPEDDLPPAGWCQPVHYRDVLKNGGAIFTNGRPADVVHAWTPREIVRQFVESYLEIHPATPHVVHLEDNEENLLERFLGKSISELRRDLKAGVEGLSIPPGLIHPNHYRTFLAEADGITVIHQMLEELPGLGREVCELVPAIYPEDFKGGQGHCERVRREYAVPDGARVVVYSGNDHFANAEDIRLLYQAMYELHRADRPIRLLRAGETLPEIYQPLPFDREQFETCLGVLPHDQVLALLPCADILVQPGKPDEFNRFRLPAKVPEFLSAGKPVILPRANVGMELQHGVNAMLTEGGNPGEIVTNFEAIDRDPALASSLASGALEFARRRFDPERVAGDALRFYQKVARP